jgi:hypothetical protein
MTRLRDHRFGTLFLLYASFDLAGPSTSDEMELCRGLIGKAPLLYFPRTSILSFIFMTTTPIHSCNFSTLEVDRRFPLSLLGFPPLLLCLLYGQSTGVVYAIVLEEEPQPQRLVA